MPKIRKLTIPFPPTTIEAELHYNQNRKFYIVGLPDDFEGNTGFVNRGETEDDLVLRVCVASRALAEAETKETFFIAVEYLIGSDITWRSDYFGGERVSEDQAMLKRFSCTFSGHGLALKHEIICRVDVLKHCRYYRAFFPFGNKTLPPERSSNSWVEKKCVLIEYTTERLDFIERMEKALGRLAFKVADFLNQDVTVLSQILDTTIHFSALPEHTDNA